MVLLVILVTLGKMASCKLPIKAVRQYRAAPWHRKWLRSRNCLGAWVLPLTWKGNIPPWSSTAQALHLHQWDFLAEYTADCCCKILEAARSNNCKLAPDQEVCRSLASNKITRRSQLTTVLRTLLPGLRRTRTYLPAAFSVHHTRKPFLHSETQNGQCEKLSILGYNNNRTNKLGHVERFHKR